MSVFPVIRMSCFQGRLTPEIKVSALFALLDYLTLYGVLRSGEGFQTFYFIGVFVALLLQWSVEERGPRLKGREGNCLREDEEETP